ncbi:hypothetical protein BDV93DRAFT_562112 [Ceratobasidium sp. AG-I]|nr:hypothetical protein BDV93DRAFT_562112 [Ceratobasidium sp. AG-I]
MEVQSTPQSHVPKPSIFALIIGINSYPEFKRLKGAVKDAKSMTEYLLNDLKVPSDNIIQLYDEQATRDAIISGFLQIKDNLNIREEDAVIIFYAGHGSEIDAPVGWETGGAKIQAIVPWDANTSDSSGGKVKVIPDRTVATLLNDIATARGDNITVILDCCHASSGTRAANPTEAALARSIDQAELPPLPANIDFAIVDYGDEEDGSDGEARASVIPVGFGRRELRSHVLLAACGAREFAWEPHGRGEFTFRLLEVLRGNDISSLTYSGLMGIFPPLQTEREQNPQCEGFNTNRILFSTLEGASSAYIRTELINKRVILKAGDAQGICAGDIFEIYTSPILDPDSLSAVAKLEVGPNVGPYHSIFINPNGLLPDVPQRAWALQTHSMSKILVHCSSALERALERDPLWREKVLSSDTDCRIRLVEPLKAQISIGLDGVQGGVWFDTHNPIVAGNGMKRLPYTVPLQADRVIAVLHAAATWNWHLARENKVHRLRDKVRMEFFRVKPRPGHYNPDGQTQTEKVGNNLNHNEPIHIVGDRYLYYGINIINDTDFDLYPYLFYFDASTFAIESKYLGPISGAGTADAPLRAHERLALGHGDGGMNPFAYHVGQNQELDIGIMKLFVTDSSVRFGSIEQKDNVFEKIPRKITRGPAPSIPRYWDASSIVLVQHKPNPGPKYSLS